MVVSWVVIAVLIFLILIFFKFKDVKHRTWTILLILFVLFFYMTFVNVLSKENIDVNSVEGVVSAGKIYFSWLGHAVKNLATITSKAVDMDWKGNLTVGG